MPLIIGMHILIIGMYFPTIGMQYMIIGMHILIIGMRFMIRPPLIFRSQRHGRLCHFYFVHTSLTLRPTPGLVEGREPCLPSWTCTCCSARAAPTRPCEPTFAHHTGPCEGEAALPALGESAACPGGKHSLPWQAKNEHQHPRGIALTQGFGGREPQPALVGCTRAGAQARVYVAQAA